MEKIDVNMKNICLQINFSVLCILITVIIDQNELKYFKATSFLLSTYCRDKGLPSGEMSSR